jgi:hypothetical protein
VCAEVVVEVGKTLEKHNIVGCHSLTFMRTPMSIIVLALALLNVAQTVQSIDPLRFSSTAE